MKIIILGAGQVGASLAENLITEQHEISLIDINEERLKELQDHLDVQMIAGRCSYPDVLRQAGAEQADMLIAVTDSDEANMVACQVAYSLFNVPTKIARIRSQHYFIRKELFGRDNLPIDVFISPEKIVTNYVHELIKHPGALQVLNFASERVKLIAVKPHYSSVLIGKTLAEVNELISDAEFKIVAIFRQNSAIRLDQDVEVRLGDEVFFVTAAQYAREILSVFRHVQEPSKRIMIAGGGSIGLHLAQTLEKQFHVKVIDINRSRCDLLSRKLQQATVLYADACDRTLLVNENIEHVDVFCALTDDDEANILACLQANRLGAKQVLALITRTAYVDLIEGGPINIAISPQQAMVGSILTHIRRGDIVEVYSLRRGAAEAIEVVAHGDRKTSSVVGRKISELKKPQTAIIGAIVRDEKVIIPDDDMEICAEDHVILFVSSKKTVRDVEKLFQVGPGFF